MAGQGGIALGIGRAQAFEEGGGDPQYVPQPDQTVLIQKRHGITQKFKNTVNIGKSAQTQIRAGAKMHDLAHQGGPFDDPCQIRLGHDGATGPLASFADGEQRKMLQNFGKFQQLQGTRIHIDYDESFARTKALSSFPSTRPACSPRMAFMTLPMSFIPEAPSA